jgi:hypothetical protein
MGRHLGRYLPEQLTLKITLAGSDPKIWRRVDMHSGLTLHHRAQRPPPHLRPSAVPSLPIYETNPPRPPTPIPTTGML